MPHNKGMVVKYEEDLFAWSQETARAISEGRWQDVDLEHVADEISDVGKTEQRGLKSQLSRIMLHLLKMRYQPQRHARSWEASVADARDQVADALEESPSLKARLAAMFPKAYRHARYQAVQQTDLPLETFPEVCPFSVEDVVGA